MRLKIKPLKNIPKLISHFMGKRKFYDSEKYTSGIFDAVSLGITFIIIWRNRNNRHLEKMFFIFLDFTSRKNT